MASEPSNGLVVPKRRSTLGKPPRKSSISKVQRVHTRTEYIHAPSGPHTQHTLLSTFSRRSRNKRRPHLQREIKSRRSVSWVQNLAESSKISPLRFRCFEDCDSEFLMALCSWGHFRTLAHYSAWVGVCSKKGNRLRLCFVSNYGWNRKLTLLDWNLMCCLSKRLIELCNWCFFESACLWFLFFFCAGLFAKFSVYFKYARDKNYRFSQRFIWYV